MPTYTFRQHITDQDMIRDVESQFDDPAFVEKLERQQKRFFKEDDRLIMEWTEVCTISEMEEKEASGATVVPAAPYIGDMVRQGLKKPSDGFRDILRNIKKKHKGSKRLGSDHSSGINTF